MKKIKLYNKIIMVVAAALPVLLLSNCTTTNIAPLPTAISTTGNVTTLAGSGTQGFANGTGTAASFFYPQGLAVDASGNVYVADQGNNEIRKITAAGAVTTFEGTLLAGSTNTAAIGVAATFNGPTGVAIDASGNIYVADYSNNLIRKIVPSTGVVSTLAGTGKAGAVNATGTSASFNGPAGIAVDAAGNVYVADFNNQMIRKISPAGVVTTIGGTAGVAGFTNGNPGTFNGPRSVAVDAAGNVYVADANNNAIREITASNGFVITLAGTGAIGNASGAGNASTFYYPSGVAVDASGNVYVADADNNLVRKITPSGTVTALAGSGYLTLTVPFNGPAGIAVDANGVVYVANEYGCLVQKVQ